MAGTGRLIGRHGAFEWQARGRLIGRHGVRHYDGMGSSEWQARGLPLRWHGVLLSGRHGGLPLRRHGVFLNGRNGGLPLHWHGVFRICPIRCILPCKNGHLISADHQQGVIIVQHSVGSEAVQGEANAVDDPPGCFAK